MDATIRVCTGGRGRVRPRGAPAAVETTHGKPRQRRRTGSGQIQQRRARLARAGRTRRAVPDQGGAPGIHPRQNRHPGRTVSRYNGSPGTGDVRGPARRGSRVTQVVQPYHATATNHQATGNEEGHVEGGTGKNHRGYVQQRLFDRRHLEGERL